MAATYGTLPQADGDDDGVALPPLPNHPRHPPLRRALSHRQRSRRAASATMAGRRAASTTTVMGQMFRRDDDPEVKKARAERRAARKEFRKARSERGFGGGLPSTTASTSHSFVYTLLNPRSHKWQAMAYKKAMAFVILVDMCFFVASTEPEWRGHPAFYYMEAFSSTLFLIEYVARLATATESAAYHHLGPLWGRLRYVVSHHAIIDALATFPFFVELLTPLELPTLTYLRIFRLLRILKTEGFAQAFNSVQRVIYYNREILYVVSLLCLFLILVTAVLMYYLRPKEDLVDAADFSSIPATMYLSTLMLTGQGGPQGDLPWYTQLIVLMTSVFSVAMFAIPASMFTWGFEAEAERLAKRAVIRNVARRRGDTEEVSSEGDAYLSSSSADTSDEEYEMIIGGDESEGEGGEEGSSRALKAILEAFKKADTDGSGSINRDEFVKSIKSLSTAAAVESGGDGAMAERVERLEAKVDEMNAKLDRLLNAVKMA